MAESLLDIGSIAQIAQNNLRNALSMAQLQQQKMSTELHERQIQQNTVFKAYDEIDKLRKTPQFADPLSQVDLVYSQAKLLKGMGIDMPLPSREQLIGNTEQFAENLRLYRTNASPAVREDAFEKMVYAMPDFGKQLIETLDAEGKTSARIQELQMKMEVHGPKLQALQVKSGRLAMQHGLYSENLGAIAQSLQVTTDPRFKKVFDSLQGKSPLAQQVILKSNPEFAKSFQEALRPHLDKLGIIDSELAQGVGVDDRPKFLAAIDDQISARMQAKNDAIERTGVAPTELAEEIAGLDVVRKAREIQYEWLKDPFNKDKYKSMLKAQQDIRILSDAAGGQLTAIQDERNRIQQTKLDMATQQGLAEDYAQERFRDYLSQGFDENKAGVLAGKDASKKFPGIPYNAEKLKVSKPLSQVTINQNSPGERKDIAEGRSQLDMVDRIETLYHPNFVGPLDSRLGRVKSFTGAIKDQEAEFRSAVQLMRTELRKFYFGTAQSRAELQGALDAIPDLDMSDEQFRASVNQTRKNVNSMLERRLETMEQSDVKAPREKTQGKPAPKPSDESGKKMDMKSRYKELEKSGMSKQDIFNKLYEEGYRSNAVN